jgi:hypothetical protein
MFVEVVAMTAMEMTVVEKIKVVVVTDRGMTAAGAMLVVVIGMRLMFQSSFQFEGEFRDEGPGNEKAAA